MKNILFIIFNILCIAAYSETYYIDPAGRDTISNDGSKKFPWKSLSYACSRVHKAGDTIHVNQGSFIETAQSLLDPGVNIEGEGISSVIISRISKESQFTILLKSEKSATDGNQSISRIKMDGNALMAYGALQTAYRKNVDINNCTIVDFNYYGVSFINGEPPLTYATGNKFHDNVITNCSGFYSGNRGALEIQGQDGMLIFNNRIVASRADNKNGDCIYGVEGFIKNCKIYNNTFIKTFVPGKTAWDFAIELWNILGGVEIYNNTIIGSIDVTRLNKGSSAYSAYIHDNNIGQKALISSESTRGIALEHNASDIIIEHNHIENVAAGIMVNTQYPGVRVQNLNIRCNIFFNIGVADSYLDYKGWGILWGAGDGDHVQTTTISNIEILNNTFYGCTGARTSMWGIELPDSGHGKNVIVRNNIVCNFDYAPVYTRQGDKAGVTLDSVSIENNIFYKNGNNNIPKYSGIFPTNNTTKNNITDDPKFVSTKDFHLKAGSPAIGTGLKISGLRVDFEGRKYKNPPSIGAYE